MKMLKTILRRLPLAIGLASGLSLMLLMGWASFSNDIEAQAQSPAVAASCAGLVVSLALYLAGLLRRAQRDRRFWGLLLLHVGLLAVFSGPMGNEMLGSRGFVFLPEKGQTHYFVGYDERDHRLPFEIRLDDFTVRAYDDSLRVRDYLSAVTINGRRHEIAVNAPVMVDGFSLYQHDCGFEASAAKPMKIVVRAGGSERTVEARINEAFPAGVSTTAVVRDFLPSASRAPDGGIMTTGRDLVLNPAFLVELEDDCGEKISHWVFADDPSGGRFETTGACGPAQTVQILPCSWPGVEYSVFSVVHSPFNPLVLAGVIGASIGMLIFYLPGRRRS